MPTSDVAEGSVLPEKKADDEAIWSHVRNTVTQYATSLGWQEGTT